MIESDPDQQGRFSRLIISVLMVSVIVLGRNKRA